MNDSTTYVFFDYDVIFTIYCLKSSQRNLISDTIMASQKSWLLFR